MKKKIGIVSSFDILCGNATYSKALLDGLPEEYERVKINLPHELRINYEDKLVKDILKKVAECDYVNIQVELGLYAPTPSLASEIVCKIIDKAKNVSLTMHRVDSKPLRITRNIYNALKEGGIWHAIKRLASSPVKYIVYRCHKKVISAGVKKNAIFIVHTKREEKRIKNENASARIVVHPIVWPETLSDSHTSIKLRQKFSDNNPVIGLFGFISEHKNFLTVLKTMLFTKYNVLLVGGTHPGSSDYGKKESGVVKNLSDFIMQKELFDRFYHLTSPDDETLVALMKAVDVIIIPYFETGQSGSGIASLAIQFGKNVVFSDTNLIAELTPFLTRKPFIFDVNSPANLVSAIEDCVAGTTKNNVRFQKYNFETNMLTYLSALGIEGK